MIASPGHVGSSARAVPLPWMSKEHQCMLISVFFVLRSLFSISLIGKSSDGWYRNRDMGAEVSEYSQTNLCSWVAFPLKRVIIYTQMCKLNYVGYPGTKELSYKLFVTFEDLNNSRRSKVFLQELQNSSNLCTCLLRSSRSLSIYN